jgi:hypothetical protein
VRQLILPAALMLAACGADPDYYLLPLPTAQTRAAAPVSTIGVAEVSLPTYAESVEIATLAETGRITVDADSLWADTPRRALTRHLVAALQTRLNAQVAAEPWPGFDRPALRVEVIADRMIGGPGAPLRFSGQYLIVSNDSGRITASNRFAIDMPLEGEGYPALMAAHARAIESLADEIAATIRGVRGGV